MMQTLMMALVLWMQTEPPKTPVAPPRQDRRDPFEGRRPAAPQTPQTPQPPMGDRRTPPINPEEVRAWLRENEPETFRRMTQFQDEGRMPAVMRILEDASARMRELNDLKQRDPKGYEKMTEMRRLERDSFAQAEAARRAQPEEREAATARLKETLGKLFDAREEVRLREIAELKRRVEALEKALGDRKANKDRLVEKRRRELMGEKTDEDW